MTPWSIGNGPVKEDDGSCFKTMQLYSIFASLLTAIASAYFVFFFLWNQLPAFFFTRRNRVHMLFPCSEARVITRKSIAGSLRKPSCVVIPITGGRCTDTSLHIQRKFYAPLDAERTRSLITVALMKSPLRRVHICCMSYSCI